MWRVDTAQALLVGRPQPELDRVESIRKVEVNLQDWISDHRLVEEREDECAQSWAKIVRISLEWGRLEYERKRDGMWLTVQRKDGDGVLTVRDGWS